ncbi:MAG: zinc ribbon domain-containing protein [Promethearchaeati archaeon SRVP18_Atabeyarchaeia-1]
MGAEGNHAWKRFVLHEHRAKRAGLHYDLRLEWDGQSVMSFAMRHSPPTESGVKRLAIEQPLHRGAARQGRLLVEVDPRHTSLSCPYCGYTGRSNQVGYSYFRCRACGFEANRDRLASLNIALRAAQTKDTSSTYKMGQFPGGSASVSTC